MTDGHRPGAFLLKGEGDAAHDFDEVEPIASPFSLLSDLDLATTDLEGVLQSPLLLTRPNERVGEGGESVSESEA